MKNSILILALACGVNYSAQTSFSLTNVTNTSSPLAIAPNATLTSGTVVSDLTKITVDVTNTSANTHTYDVKRYDLAVNTLSDEDMALPNFCFATKCYVMATKLSDVSLVLAPGTSASQSTLEFNMLDADLIEATQIGFTAVRYTIFESNNKNDSIQFSIFYNSNKMLVGLKDQAKIAAGFEVFPNPAKGTVKVSMLAGADGYASLQLINAIGETVLEKELHTSTGINNLALDIQAYPAGVYFLRCQSGESVNTKKLVIE